MAMGSICYFLLVISLVEVPTLGRSVHVPRVRRPKSIQHVPEDMKSGRAVHDQLRSLLARHDVQQKSERSDISQPNKQLHPEANKAKLRSQETKLLDDLFGEYRTDVFPGAPTSVEFGMQYNCADYDEKRHLLTSSTIPYFNWNDERLRWDPSQFSGIQSLRVHVYRIWTPDITLYNGAENEREWNQAIVRDNGDVEWIPRITYKSYCVPTGANSASCNLTLGSWTMSGEKLNLTASFTGVHTDKTETEVVDLSNYFAGCPYKVASHESRINVVKYDCCPENYVTANIQLNIVKNG